MDLENERVKKPVWDDYLRKGLVQIVQLVYFFFLINHDPQSEEYAAFIRKILYAIVQVIEQLSGIYRPIKSLPFTATSVVRFHQREDNTKSCVDAICRTIDLREIKLSDDITLKEKETDPFLQWCALYFSPHLYNYREDAFGHFVREVYGQVVGIREEYTETYLSWYQTQPIDNLVLPPGFTRRA